MRTKPTLPGGRCATLLAGLNQVDRQVPASVARDLHRDMNLAMCRNPMCRSFGVCSATIKIRTRIASPEMLPMGIAFEGHWDEEDEHGGATNWSPR